MNTDCIAEGMTDRRELTARRLRESREKAGYATATAAANAFGWGVSTYTHHENGTRAFGVEEAIRYGKPLKVNPGYLLGLDAIDTPAFKDVGAAVPSKQIEVIGAVQAGTWRERSSWPPEERYQIEVGYSLIAGAERFGLVVEGFSMDLTPLPPGTELECVRVYKGRLDPQENDLVIVERRHHDLVETTCKRLVRGKDGWELHAESTRPEFKEPILLGSPDKDHFGDDSVEVIGIVVRALQNHYAQRRRVPRT